MLDRAAAPPKRFQLGPASTEEWAYLALSLSSVCGVAYWFASPYAVPALRERATAGGAFLFIAATIAFIYCYRKPQAERWTRALVAGILMLADAAVVYSVTRHEVVLIAFSSLFCLPGVALGGAAGLGIARLRADLADDERRPEYSATESGSGPAQDGDANGASTG